MGLDDLLPEGADKSSSSSSSGRKTASQSSEDEGRDIHKEFGSGNLKKSFTEEQWEKVKRVVEEEFGLNINVVCNGYSAEKRYQVLHEAVMFDDGDEADLPEVIECPICEADLDTSGVEIEGEQFCVHHTAGQIRSYLDGELEDDSN